MNRAAILTFALMLTTGLLGTQAFAAGDAEAGGKLFSRTCGGCHQVGESARPGFGPELNGVIGRTAGSTTGYQYSEAMKSQPPQRLNVIALSRASRTAAPLAPTVILGG
ncbi:c-type cytochrome [Pseudomonas sp. NPDC087342]|uniref:c-type cytochrome n=1 Tax=Pseudomonas sp. NPDC087342 TaxID=3364437 RepID=UPI0038018453